MKHFLAFVLVITTMAACGAPSGEEGDGVMTQGPTASGRFGRSPDGNGVDLYENDPLPKWCGPGGGVAPPRVSGTEACPDDKNKPGCGCDKPGDTAACWTGLRKHRRLGVCKDGITTCVRKDEVLSVWGPCEGQTLPTPNAPGAEGCSCFSSGEWKIANTAPCLRGGTTVSAMSTVYRDSASTNCGLNELPIPPIGTPPPGAWSPNTLKVDCAGRFRLCFRIRAGKHDDPRSTDCTLGESCTDADYLSANVEQALPDLGAWAGKDTACAKKWEIDTPADVSPGYAEMIVTGRTLACESVDDGTGHEYVFHRIPYCPRMCRSGANASSPECVACQLAGRGAF